MKTQKELSAEAVGIDPRTNDNELLMRGNQVTRRDDTADIVSIGLQDIDSAIMYYFNEVIKPRANVYGENIAVPVVYGTPERWQAVKKEGSYRDKDGKRQIPIIIFKRNSVEKVRNITSKVDANYPHNFYITGQAYTSRNQYDRFNLMNKTVVPQKSYTLTVVPDYVKLRYSCIILTDYVTQMNPIVEAINFASDAYWGDPERFKFQAFVNSINTEIQSPQGSDRTVRSTFDIDLRGYIIPAGVMSNPYINLKRFNKTHTRISVSEQV